MEVKNFSKLDTGTPVARSQVVIYHDIHKKKRLDHVWKWTQRPLICIAFAASLQVLRAQRARHGQDCLLYNVSYTKLRSLKILEKQKKLVLLRRSNQVYSEGFSFLTCTVKVSMRTCITVTRYRIQYKTKEAVTRIAFRWLFITPLSWRSRSPGVHMGPLHTGKCSYFQ